MPHNTNTTHRLSFGEVPLRITAKIDSPHMDEETLTLEEVAKLLQMQPQAVARIKGLTAFRVGWQGRVRKRDLVKWMANQKLNEQ